MGDKLNIMLEQAINAFQQGSYESAVSILNKILQHNSKNLPALHILGLIKASQEKYSESAELLGRALQLNPNDPSISYNLAKALYDSGAPNTSLIHYQKTTKLAPNYLEAWIGYAKVLSEFKRYEEALSAINKSIQINPNLAELWSNKGNILHGLKCYDEALNAFKKAILINPDFADAYYNQGITQHELGLLNDAITSFKKTISLRPNFASARWNLSLCNLQQGNYHEGFANYESRTMRGEENNYVKRRGLDRPYWLGLEPIENKKILLYGEQGFGDYIQFCRYVKTINDLGGRVILECPKELYDLVSRLDGYTEIVMEGEELPDFDCHSSLLSLPFALKSSIDTIPKNKAYLSADPNKINFWLNKLGAKNKIRVGIAWSSTSGFKGDSKRSLKLDEFVDALPSDRFEYICLQKELKDSDKDFFDSYRKIKFFGDQINNFDDTAALIECVDLVISTCTSIPHLSGALGKRTLILLSYVPDWRWLLTETKSPWYPTVKLFRQEKLDDWSAPLRGIKSEILKMDRI